MTEGAARVSLPDGIVLQHFRPVAYYDKHLDCIRVVTHNRSVTEVRIEGAAITLLMPNHRAPHDPEFVGFTVKGVNALFHAVGLSLSDVVTVAELIDSIVKHKPVTSMAAVIKLLKRDNSAIGEMGNTPIRILEDVAA